MIMYRMIGIFQHIMVVYLPENIVTNFLLTHAETKLYIQ